MESPEIALAEPRLRYLFEVYVACTEARELILQQLEKNQGINGVHLAEALSLVGGMGKAAGELMLFVCGLRDLDPRLHEIVCDAIARGGKK